MDDTGPGCRECCLGRRCCVRGETCELSARLGRVLCETSLVDAKIRSSAEFTTHVVFCLFLAWVRKQSFGVTGLDHGSFKEESRLVTAS